MHPRKLQCLGTHPHRAGSSKLGGGCAVISERTGTPLSSDSSGSCLTALLLRCPTPTRSVHYPRRTSFQEVHADPVLLASADTRRISRPVMKLFEMGWAPSCWPPCSVLNSLSSSHGIRDGLAGEDNRPLLHWAELPGIST